MRRLETFLSEYSDKLSFLNNLKRFHYKFSCSYSAEGLGSFVASPYPDNEEIVTFTLSKNVTNFHINSSVNLSDYFADPFHLGLVLAYDSFDSVIVTVDFFLQAANVIECLFKKVTTNSITDFNTTFEINLLKNNS